MTDNELFGNSEQLDNISRAEAINAICEDGTQLERQGQYTMTMAERKQRDADILDALPSAKPVAKDTNVPVKDCISRRAAISICDNAIDLWNGQLGTGALVAVRDAIMALPSAQLNLSEAYSKAVFTWLMDYQIRAAELKGRYTPYEVLSWVANDWRKEHERFD